MHLSMWRPRGGRRGNPGASDGTYCPNPRASDTRCWPGGGGFWREIYDINFIKLYYIEILKFNYEFCIFFLQNYYVFCPHPRGFWQASHAPGWGFWHGFLSSVRIPWVCPSSLSWGITLTGAYSALVYYSGTLLLIILLANQNHLFWFNHVNACVNGNIGDGYSTNC